MTLRIARNRNTQDTSSVKDGIALNKNTAVTIVDANPNRIFIHVNNNDENFGIWVRELPADIDPTIKKGVFIRKQGGKPYERSGDNIYTGEISAIADNDAPKAYVTEN